MTVYDLGLLAVALLALAGWAATNAYVSASILPMANALRVLSQVDAAMDERVNDLFQRIKARQTKGKPAPKQQQNPNEAAAAAVSELFGGSPLEPLSFGEQPDPEGLEVIG